jgi:hypothetical protein
MMAPRPCLYDIAASELSQDAFLCRLLSYADPTHREACPEIHALGQSFLRLIFLLSGNVRPRVHILSVVAERQVSRIDILCTINGTIAIAIEDKTDTVESPHQLVNIGATSSKILAMLVQS